MKAFQEVLADRKTTCISLARLAQGMVISSHFQKSESETSNACQCFRNSTQFAAVSESERMYDFALEKISSEIQTENVTCGHI